MTSTYGVASDMSMTVNNAGTLLATGRGGSGVATGEGYANVTNATTGLIAGEWGIVAGGALGGAPTSIVNSGTVATRSSAGSANVSIDTSSGNATGATITNSGTLQGDVMLGTNNTLTVLGNTAKISGNIVTRDTTSSVFIGNAGTTAAFTGTGQFGAAAGTQTRDGVVYSTAALGTFGIAAGSTFTAGSEFGLTAVQVSNGGTFNLFRPVSVSVSGSWDQSGAIDIGLTGATAEALNIAGTLMFGAGSSLGIAAGSSDLTAGTYRDVLTTGAETGRPTLTSGTFDGDYYAYNLESGSTTAWDLTISTTAPVSDVPEPASALVLVTGILGLGTLRRRPGRANTAGAQAVD